MIRSWVEQISSFYLPPAPTQGCSIILSASPLSVAKLYGQPYGAILRVGCTCLPFGSYLGDRPSEEDARTFWSAHQQNRGVRNDQREEVRKTLF